MSEDITNKYSEIEWRDIKDFRNILIHEYFGVDFEIVWNAIKEDGYLLTHNYPIIYLN